MGVVVVVFVLFVLCWVLTIFAEGFSRGYRRGPPSWLDEGEDGERLNDR